MNWDTNHIFLVWKQKSLILANAVQFLKKIILTYRDISRSIKVKKNNLETAIQLLLYNLIYGNALDASEMWISVTSTPPASPVHIWCVKLTEIHVTFQKYSALRLQTVGVESEAMIAEIKM